PASCTWSRATSPAPCTFGSNGASRELDLLVRLHVPAEADARPAGAVVLLGRVGEVDLREREREVVAAAGDDHVQEVDDQIVEGVRATAADRDRGFLKV